MDDIDLFPTETITVPIGFRIFAISQLSLSLTIGKLFGYLAGALDRVMILKVVVVVLLCDDYVLVFCDIYKHTNINRHSIFECLLHSILRKRNIGMFKFRVLLSIIFYQRESEY